MQGIHTMAFEQYAAAEGVSKSMLDHIAPPNTPAHYKAALTQKDKPETDAQRLGRLTHRWVLEPDTMPGAFYVKPAGMKFSNKEGIAWREEHQDKPIIDEEEATLISALRDAVWRDPEAKRLLTGAETERSLFVTDRSGTLRKARIDVIPKGWKILGDLKTVESAADGEVEKKIDNYRWHVQAPYYIDAMELLGDKRQGFAFVFVEKRPPYLVRVMQLDPLVVEYGRKCYQRDLTLLRYCQEHNEWPGYSGQVVSLPPYRMREVEQAA